MCRMIDVGFWEADFVVVEDEGPLSISITASERISLGESLIMEVVPMTLGEYIAMNGHLPAEINANGLDPAESGKSLASFLYLYMYILPRVCAAGLKFKKVIWCGVKRCKHNFQSSSIENHTQCSSAGH